MSEASETESAAYKLTLDGDGVKVAKTIDSTTAREVLALVMGGSPPSSRAPARRASRAKSGRRTGKPADGTGATTRPRRRSGSPGIVKDLSLRPSGKKAFADFAAEKAPKTHMQKQALIVYWLQR